MHSQNTAEARFGTIQWVDIPNHIGFILDDSGDRLVFLTDGAQFVIGDRVTYMPGSVFRYVTDVKLEKDRPALS